MAKEKKLTVDFEEFRVKFRVASEAADYDGALQEAAKGWGVRAALPRLHWQQLHACASAPTMSPCVCLWPCHVALRVPTVGMAHKKLC